MSQNREKETAEEQKFRALQDRIFESFGAAEPSAPVLRCRNATQTSVVLEWDPVELATADLVSLSLYRNGQKAGSIPRPLQMHSTKISGLAVDTEYTFHLVLRTSAGTRSSEKVVVRTHKMTDLSGVTITTGILPSPARESLAEAVDRIGAKLVDGVRIDTTHFVTTEGRGTAWEKAVENNIPVVRPEWVHACEKNGRILGVTKFYLDAMLPGPSDEAIAPAAPPPPPPAKDEEPVESRNGKSEEKEDEKGDDDATDNAADDQESKQDDEQVAEPKSKTESHPDEQKMRLEDKEEQKVALRPSVAAEDGQDDADATPTGEHASYDETADDAADKDDAATEQVSDEKPSPTPDGSSFQEVEL